MNCCKCGESFSKTVRKSKHLIHNISICRMCYLDYISFIRSELVFDLFMNKK